MADVTIGQLDSGIPDKGSAIIPYSDGSTTYKTSPSGIVAASPGSILRVFQNVVNTVQIVTPVGNLNTTLIVPGLSGVIKPLSSSNKVLVDANILGGFTAHGWFKLERAINSDVYTPVQNALGIVPPTQSSAAAVTSESVFSGNTYETKCVVVKYLDSPNTTQEVKYRFGFYTSYGSGYPYKLNTSDNNGNNVYTGIGITTITLWEIAG